MIDTPYHYTFVDFGHVLLMRFFPERTDGESAVMRDFLLAHIHEYDRLDFSVRIGQGATVDPTTSRATQRQTAFVSRLKIDILAWRSSQPVIIEVKQRVTPAALGQILTYRHHVVEEFPDAPEPELVVVGREAAPDALVALQAHGVTVYLYPPTDAGGDAAGSRV
jgi:hypothetical protein